MATARLVPSAYTRSSTNRVTVTDPTNMYNNTDHTASYCSIRGRNSSSSTYYAFIHGFNFGSIPSNAIVSSFAIKIRCYKNSYLQQTTSYRPRLASTPYNNSVIADTTLESDVTTTSGGTVYTFPNGSLTWNTLKGYGSDFSIEVPLRSSGNSYPYLYVYGAEIEVNYSTETIHPTGVSVSPSTASIEVSETTTLTETVTPSNATDKSVTWSSSNTAVATVSGGVVTGVSAGSATITVTTTDGGYTATCAVTVTPAVLYEYEQANTLEPGKQYLIANGNSGSVYILSNESGGSRLLKGVSATVSNGHISITGAVKSKCEFDCELYDSNNSITTVIKSGNAYLYSDSGTGLRFYETASMNRWWHLNGTKFWLFKSNTTDGWTDTSSEYKYYLEVSSGNFTDNHLTSPAVADTPLPAMYLFTPYVASVDTISFKDNGSWVSASKVYKKVSGSWVEQQDLTTVFDPTKNYVKG